MAAKAPGVRARVVAIAGGALIVAFVAAFGQALFFGGDLNMTLAPLAGLLAALWARKPLEAAAAAALGVVIGALVAPLVSGVAWAAVGEWLPMVLVAAPIAAGLGAVGAIALDASPRMTAVLGFVCVAIVIGCLAAAVLQRAATPFSDGQTLAQLIAPADESRPLTTDESMYALYIRGVAEGRPYYATVAQVLERRNHELEGSVNARSPLSYRLPTLYVLLSMLGRGSGIILAGIAWTGLGVLFAYLLARHYLGPPLAVIAAVLVAAYYVGYVGGVQLLDTELWASVLGLGFLASFVGAERATANRRVLLALAVGAALLASLVRELALGFLLVGLAASLLPRRDDRLRRAVPWVASIGVALAAYVLHWRAASAAIASTASAAQPTASWLQPIGAPLASAAWFAGVFMRLAPLAVVALFGLGLLGSVLGPRDPGERLALGLTAVGGALVCVFAGPGGSVGLGVLTPPYWATLVVPAILACVPLVALLLERDRSQGDVPQAS